MELKNPGGILSLRVRIKKHTKELLEYKKRKDEAISSIKQGSTSTMTKEELKQMFPDMANRIGE